MRISDWSSDVCSSDLHRQVNVRPADMAGSTEGRSEGDAAQQEGHTGCQREFGHAEVQRQEYLDRRKAEEGSRTADCTGKDAADKQGRPAVLRLDDRAETEQLRQHQYLDGATGNRIQGLLVELGDRKSTSLNSSH